jgi:pimeloyl-ACP methyl ester carboxylesterase
MVLRIFKYTCIGLVVLIGALVLGLAISANMALDSDLNHTRASKQLPGFAQASRSGLVRISANGMTFRARIAGFDSIPDKPTVILLHGFPVTSAMWIELIEPLARAGFQVVAFDQRGYSPEARPANLDAYDVDKLTDDVMAVADAVGASQFHLVGHDWGAAVGWSTVLTYPERVLSWTGLSIAHPAAFSQALENDPDQQSRSGYFALFRTPWLSESIFSFNNFSLLRGLYQTMLRDQADEYLAVFSEPKALTAALNWYRAMGTGPGNLDEINTDVHTPTLFIWGNQDAAVGRSAIDAMAAYMKGPYRSVETNAGHWLLTDEPQRVIDEVLRHISYVGNHLPIIARPP